MTLLRAVKQKTVGVMSVPNMKRVNQPTFHQVVQAGVPNPKSISSEQEIGENLNRI